MHREVRNPLPLTAARRNPVSGKPLPIPAPRTVLRIMMNVWLVGTGVSAIYQASHVGPGYDRLGLAHQLTIFCFFGLVIFAVLYAEYRLVQELSKRELNAALGYVESLGCFVLLLSGIAAIRHSHSKPTAHFHPAWADSALKAAFLFGQIVFLLNAVWSYVRGSERR